MTTTKDAVTSGFDTAIALMCESVNHLDIKGRNLEIAKATLRAAVEYAQMRRAGFVLLESR